jgi:hypothetical protein
LQLTLYLISHLPAVRMEKKHEVPTRTSLRRKKFPVVFQEALRSTQVFFENLQSSNEAFSDENLKKFATVHGLLGIDDLKGKNIVKNLSL